MKPYRTIATAAALAVCLAGCERKAGVPAPGIAETKAIAEEAFIYGLLFVMAYTAIPA
jgi:hypothetical protein